MTKEVGNARPTERRSGGEEPTNLITNKLNNLTNCNKLANSDTYNADETESDRLTDPDGKDNGVELVIKLQATNKAHINEGYNISVSYSNSRLQLDNGTNVTCKTGTDYLRAEPEATGKEESWTYEIPAGAKPTALNLFMDDTRVSVGVAMSEK